MRPPEAFRALESRPYLAVWAAGLVSMTGDFAHSIAETWLVLELTGSAAAVGLTATLFGAPMMVFVLFGGVIADALDRRITLAVVMLVRIVMVGLLAALTYLELVQPWHIYLLALALGTCLSVSIPSMQALVPTLVPSDQIKSAFALSSATLSLGSVIGRSAGGFIVTAIGYANTFAFNALTYVAPLVAYLGLRVPPQQTRGLTARKSWADLLEGLRYVGSQRPILSSMLVLSSVNSFGMTFMIMAPVFVKEALGEGPVAVGLLMGAWSLGQVGGSLLVGQFGKGTDPLRLMLGIGVFSALGLAGFSQAPTLIVSAGIFVGLGVLVSVMTVAQSSFLVAEVPDQFRGRVMSVNFLAFVGVIPVFTLLVGALAEAFGIRLVILWSSAGLLGVIAIIWMLTRSAASEGSGARDQAAVVSPPIPGP